MKSRLQRNHPELFEQTAKENQAHAYDDALDKTVQDNDISDNGGQDNEKTLKLSVDDIPLLEQLRQEAERRPSRPKRNINKWLTITIIVEIIVLSVVLFIAFKK